MDEDANGHEFDGAGVCIYCARCDEPGCCPQEPCSHSLTKAFRDSVRRVIEDPS